MVSLLCQKDFRSAQALTFCYLCGKSFVQGDPKNRDHLPAQCIFLAEDREPLWLPTHVACNGGESVIDERMGQLIALRCGKTPSSPEKRRLDITAFSDAVAAVTNLPIDQAFGDGCGVATPRSTASFCRLTASQQAGRW